MESSEPRLTVSFYKYARIPDPQAFRDWLFLQWSALGVLGRVYVATEGINAQISIPEKNKEQFKQLLDSVSFLQTIRLNFAVDDNGKSFFKLKIKVRSKILADGLDDKTFDVTNVGRYLNAEEFNRLTDDPETILIDMRNHYESEVGHFENAILPDADTFREELKMVEEMLKGKEDKNIVMYCTGGIRCEKASAWLKHKGFKKVHQLEGGIIHYARQVKALGLRNKFHGKNFVFDERLGERITDEVISSCHQCGSPSDRHVNCKNEGCHLLFIQCEECARQYDGCCSAACRDFIQLPVEKQKELRKGLTKGRNVYRKGRFVRRLQGS
ncbi:MAG: hypothetical protein KatS3mg031_2386 [Chitinophagales bacterium]|nr:MAG: hypothetical protein KatS3mg031_2386 [Chitinophagales bacterium]